MKPAFRRALEALRYLVLEDFRAHWQLDDRWSPWRPDPERERFEGWTARDYEARDRRSDHNGLARALVEQLRALSWCLKGGAS